MQELRVDNSSEDGSGSIIALSTSNLQNTMVRSKTHLALAYSLDFEVHWRALVIKCPL
jgi:hypothetical protein